MIFLKSDGYLWFVLYRLIPGNNINHKLLCKYKETQVCLKVEPDKTTNDLRNLISFMRSIN